MWHFELLTWESIGKPKMWNISKTADRIVKRMKIWESGNYSAHMYRGLLMPDSLILAWGYSVHFTNFQFSTLYSSPNFHLISTKLHCKWFGYEEYRL